MVDMYGATACRLRLLLDGCSQRFSRNVLDRAEARGSCDARRGDPERLEQRTDATGLVDLDGSLRPQLGDRSRSPEGAGIAVRYGAVAVANDQRSARRPPLTSTS